MPVNFPQIQQQVRQMGAEALRTRQALHQKLEQARFLLAAADANPDALKQRIEQAYALNQNLRCAAPTDEPLGSIHPLPELPGPFTLLAADGSQINPDRHAPVEFCVINLGAFRMQPGQGITPREITQSELLYKEEDLYTSQGRITEEIVALRRDLLERRLLAELARQESGPVVALTDGPMELFRKPEASDLYTGLMDQFVAALHELNDLGTISAGYVDKPAADLVVRMLELMLLPEDELRQAGKNRPLIGVTDAGLLGVDLPAGARTAVFTIKSRSTENVFHGPLALHFFYLNVNPPGQKPWLARVEVPAWVAEDPGKLDTLHAALIQQCRTLGGRAYPYALHRAHEVAVIKLDEKNQLTVMIQAELARNGVEIGEASHKQGVKDISGSRTR
jgi:hypothetical protein